jgi:hypothetical protein
MSLFPFVDQPDLFHVGVDGSSVFCGYDERVDFTVFAGFGASQPQQ